MEFPQKNMVLVLSAILMVQVIPMAQTLTISVFFQATLMLQQLEPMALVLMVMMQLKSLLMV